MGAQENNISQEVVNGGEVDATAATEVDNNKDVSYKGNEDRKIFVGGIPYDVTNEDLSGHFTQYGDVTQAQVKFDRTTGRSRGFAFVEFATPEACKSALNSREQLIKNKQCEIKPAKSREVGYSNKKVFVGGLPSDFPEEELRHHFEQYGKVEDIEWPFDKQTKARRNFAFIVFEEEEAADRAASVSKQTFGARECDVKKAVPQSKRNNFLPRGNMGGLRGAYGGGMRGPALAVHNAATQWFNNGGWPQMSVPYATGGTGTTAGGWGDWYGNAASAANFYAQGGTQAGNYGAYGATNGYDYNQVSNGNSRPQNGNSSATPRYQQQQQQF